MPDLSVDERQNVEVISAALLLFASDHYPIDRGVFGEFLTEGLYPVMREEEIEYLAMLLLAHQSGDYAVLNELFDETDRQIAEANQMSLLLEDNNE